LLSFPAPVAPSPVCDTILSKTGIRWIGRITSVDNDHLHFLPCATDDTTLYRLPLSELSRVVPGNAPSPLSNLLAATYTGNRQPTQVFYLMECRDGTTLRILQFKKDLFNYYYTPFEFPDQVRQIPRSSVKNIQGITGDSLTNKSVRAGTILKVLGGIALAYALTWLILALLLL
jgi:hypothetical protein